MNEISASPNQVRRVRAVDVMTRDPLTCHPDDHLLDAAARMQQYKVRHLPVVDGDHRLIGMLADRDIRTAVGDPDRWMDDVTPGLEDLQVAGAMSAPAVAIPDHTPLVDVARRLVQLEVGALPVTGNAGRLVGIVSYIDVLRALRG